MVKCHTKMHFNLKQHYQQVTHNIYCPPCIFRSPTIWQEQLLSYLNCQVIHQFAGVFHWGILCTPRQPI